MSTHLAEYERFLQGRRLASEPCGFDARREDLPAKLFEWQKDLTCWLLRRGRGALWADTGLGKGWMALAWGEQVYRHTLKPVLIFAPLAVSQQFRREGEKLGVPVQVCRSQADVVPGVNVANYERLGAFDPSLFGGLGVDESSILSGDGPLRKGVTEFGALVPYRSEFSATPAPNDVQEIINHAEFLGIMRGDEILALWFRQDGNTTHKWRLKGHAKRDFWKWLSSWAVAVRKPSDLGYSDEGYILPPLRITQHTVDAPPPDGALFATDAVGLNEQRQARRDTLTERVRMAAEIVARDPGEPWLIWAELNDESKALAKVLGAVEVTGSDSSDVKESRILDFIEGRSRVLVSKPSIAGQGLNLQHCARELFIGQGNSFRAYYQGIRRCWRFGQTRPVEAHVIVSEADGQVVRNIERKEREHSEMMDELVRHMDGLSTGSQGREEMEYREDVARGRGWTLYLGDCVRQLRHVGDASVGLTVFSPPFPSMYAYTNSPLDMGNSATFRDMLDHFRFLIPELLRVTLPGRSCAVHLTQALAFLSRDGYCGMKDFRGEVIRTMEEAGFIYYGETTIDKNPQLKAIRTKDRGLLFKTLATDASHMHMALADYLLQFRKPGENAVPIRAGVSQKYANPDGWITSEEWIRWARPVWYAADFAPDGDGISETDVLNPASAREVEDDKHLCPLQLGVIERAIKLWSNPGDLILTPFAGIGSELYQAVKLGRRAVGVELKTSYFQQAVRNLRAAEGSRQQLSLFEEFAAAEPAVA